MVGVPASTPARLRGRPDARGNAVLEVLVDLACDDSEGGRQQRVIWTGEIRETFSNDAPYSLRPDIVVSWQNGAREPMPMGLSGSKFRGAAGRDKVVECRIGFGRGDDLRNFCIGKFRQADVLQRADTLENAQRGFKVVDFRICAVARAFYDTEPKARSVARGARYTDTRARRLEGSPES